MNTRLLLMSVVTVWALCAAGCAKQPAQVKSARGGANYASAFNGAADRLLNAQSVRIQYLDVYHLTLPMGAVSRSEEFWKRVDEQGVDIGT